MGVAAVNMTVDSIAFTQALLDLGAVTGSSVAGNLDIHPKIRLLVDALYQVLAGGSVTGTVPGTLTISAGLPAVFDDLRNNMEPSCTKAINDTNSAVKYKLVLEF